MKRLTAITLAFVLLLCFTTALAAAPGSSGDPLISRSYITGTFLPSLLSETKAQVSTTIGAAYTDAEKQITDTYNAADLTLGGYAGYQYADAFLPLNLPTGTSAQLVTGGTFILTSGAASLQIEKGTVINISTGTEVTSGSALTLYQRYFCAENTAASFIPTAASTGQVDGYYKSSGTVISNPIIFSDIKTTDWFYNAVDFVTAKGLFSGITTSTFEPQTSMTRGMFVTVLYRLAGKPAVSASSSFADVTSASQYYYAAVVWASANKVVSGYDDGKFHPGDLITREQMAAIMYRYAAYAGYSTVISGTTAYDAFPDKSSVSSFAADPLKWATAGGLINGSDGKLLPANTATRAQVAQIVMNFCQKVIGL